MIPPWGRIRCDRVEMRPSERLLAWRLRGPGPRAETWRYRAATGPPRPGRPRRRRQATDWRLC